MPQQYTQKELWGLFDVLPKELKDAILSEETAETIRKTCEQYEIKEQSISEIAKLVGDVLMGLLAPERFFQSLQSNLNIEKETAQNIFQKINRFIFFPVKNLLSEFYLEIDFAPEKIEPEKTASTEKREETKKIEDDFYREPLN